MNPARELLDAVERSPRAAAAHDRAAWVGLFTDDGRVEDPVGSRPHVGHTQISRFYDTFIGPRDVTFHVDADIVVGTTVVRDVTLEVVMAPGVCLMVPAFIRYDLRLTESGWRITSLRAYWELGAMLTQFLRSGPRSVPVSMRLCTALLRNQRPSGTVAFLAALGGPGARAKRLVEAALANGRLREDLRNCRWHKVIAAGTTVAAAVVTTAGPGVVVVDVDRRGTKIVRTELFGNQ